MKKKKTVNWYLLPIIISIGFVPFVSRLKLVQTNLSKYEWYSNTATGGDFFTYWKSVWFLGAAVLALIMLVDRVLLQREMLIKDRSQILLAGYAILVLMSAAISVDRTISFKGMPEQYETVWVLLGYLLLFYYTCCTIKTEADVKIVMRILLVSAGGISLIGLSQYAGHDFFASAPGGLLLFPKSLQQFQDTAEFSFADTVNRVYATLCNPNYVGVYVAMLLPLSAAGICTAKKRIWKTACCLLLFMLLLCMAGSGSRTALIVTGILLILTFVLLSKILLKKWKVCIGLLAVIVVCLVAANAVCGGRPLKRLCQGFKTQTGSTAVEEISCGSENVKIVYKGKAFYLSLEGEIGAANCFVEDSDGRPIKLKQKKDGLYHIAEKKYKKLAMGTESDETGDFLYVKTGKQEWMFCKDSGEEQYKFYTIYGKTTDIQKAKSLGFSGYEKFLTNRGYIWSRTIPLLKAEILIGSGPETFAVVFPQNDYVARRNTSEDLYESHLLKPHNLYLQTAVQTGVLSLLFLLIFGGIYVVDSWKLYFHREAYSALEVWGMTLFLAVLSFALTGLTNDSSIATGSVFWGLWGCGQAVNRMVRKIDRPVSG